MTTFKAPRLEFVTALADAAIGAGNDKTLPMLMAVFLSGDKGAESVTLTATDRFVMIQRVVQLEQVLEDDIRALIPLEQVNTLVGVLKLTTRRDPSPLELTVDDAYLTADNVGVPLDSQPYVKFTSILEGALERQGADINLLAVNLGYLTKIGKLSAAKARKGVAHIRFTPAGSRGAGQPGPLVVDLGDDGATRVLLMPARVDR